MSNISPVSSEPLFEPMGIALNSTARAMPKDIEQEDAEQPLFKPIDEPLDLAAAMPKDIEPEDAEQPLFKPMEGVELTGSSPPWPLDSSPLDVKSAKATNVKKAQMEAKKTAKEDAERDILEYGKFLFSSRVH